MEKIDMTFVRNVEAKLEDCTTPIQYREILEKFKSYLYNGQIIKLFQNRLTSIIELRQSSLTSDIFDSIGEDLENYIADKCNYSPDPAILKKSTKGRKKDKPLEAESVIVINLSVNSSEGSIMEDVRKAIIKIGMEKALGKRKEACRILGISMQDLGDVLKVQDMKTHVRKVKQHVKSEVVKKKI